MLKPDAEPGRRVREEATDSDISAMKSGALYTRARIHERLAVVYI